MGARVTRCSGNATGAQRGAYSRVCGASTAKRPAALGYAGAGPASLLLDLPLALVQVEVADGAVEVERPFLHALEGLQIERPLVEDVFGLLAEGRGQRNDVADRVHGDVEHAPHAVAEREGRQQRQHQVAALLPVPHAERLYGVLVALLDAELILGDVGHARPSERGVDEEARQLPAGAVQFALEHAVHEPLGKADVVKEGMDDLLLPVA